MSNNEPSRQTKHWRARIAEGYVSVTTLFSPAEARALEKYKKATGIGHNNRAIIHAVTTAADRIKAKT